MISCHHPILEGKLLTMAGLFDTTLWHLQLPGLLHGEEVGYRLFNLFLSVFLGVGTVLRGGGTDNIWGGGALCVR